MCHCLDDTAWTSQTKADRRDIWKTVEMKPMSLLDLWGCWYKPGCEDTPRWQTFWKLLLAETKPKSLWFRHECFWACFKMPVVHTGVTPRPVRQSETSLRTIRKYAYAFSAARETNAIHTPCISILFLTHRYRPWQAAMHKNKGMI